MQIKQNQQQQTHKKLITDQFRGFLHHPHLHFPPELDDHPSYSCSSYSSSLSALRKMPSVIRKLLIYAAVDGLILQPYGNNSNGSRHGGGGTDGGNESSPSSIRIDYKTSKISSFPAAAAVSEQIERGKDAVGLEVYGLVGMSLLCVHLLAGWIWFGSIDLSGETLLIVLDIR